MWKSCYRKLAYPIFNAHLLAWRNIACAISTANVNTVKFTRSIAPTHSCFPHPPYSIFRPFNHPPPRHSLNAYTRSLSLPTRIPFCWFSFLARKGSYSAPTPIPRPLLSLETLSASRTSLAPSTCRLLTLRVRCNRIPGFLPIANRVFLKLDRASRTTRIRLFICGPQDVAEIEKSRSNLKARGEKSNFDENRGVELMADKR